MTNLEIARRRMRSQKLTGGAPHTPTEIVRWMGAVQAQDAPAAMWAVGLRANLGYSAVEQALAEGSILRLHVLRPTWHLVTAEDARWLLALTGPRVIAGTARRLRELGLDGAVIARSQEVFHRALEGGRQLTRAELEQALNRAGISTAVPQSLVHLLVRAELDGLLCSGAKQGKQNTYALLDDRTPPGQPLERETALAELARRYFTSHGPATLKDYTWWSGLTAAEARAGISAAELESEEIDKQAYYFNSTEVDATSEPPDVYLLPNYDEYVVAYASRDAIFDPACADRLHMRGGVLNNTLIIDGMVRGSWRREIKKSGIRVIVDPLWRLDEAERQAVENAAKKYGAFWSQPAEMKLEEAEREMGC